MAGIGPETRTKKSGAFDEHAVTTRVARAMGSRRPGLTAPSLPSFQSPGLPRIQEGGWRSRRISRILSPVSRRTGHRVAAISLGAASPRPSMRPTRELRAGHPLPAWPCSGWGLPSRPVARPLVSSYLTFSPLPLLETVGTDPVSSGGRSVSVALSAGHPAWALPSTLPCGVRTFLERHTIPRPRPPGRLLHQRV
jgi:hypothetical protein